jgi:Cysteine rich repeat
MPRRLLLLTSVCLGLAAASAVAGPAAAQSDVARLAKEKAERSVKKVLKNCEKELNTYCSQVTPGEGRLALCMMAHEDKISDTCFASIFEFVDGVELGLSNLWRAADVCESDIEKNCAGVEPGEGRIAQCLIEKKDAVSTPCKAELAGLETRLKN